MPDFTVIRVGTDTSGRPVLFTRYAWTVWRAVLARTPVSEFAHRIVITQGAFMSRAGGGAAASAGYHDLGGCWDIRTWNLTRREIDILIRELRKAAIAAWRRDLSYLHGGMDPHAHVTMGSDYPLAAGARASWRGYLNNQNGLASGRVDYEWRPSPLVTKPPAHLLQEDYMATSAAEKKLDKALDQITALTERVNDIAAAEANRDQKFGQRLWEREKKRREAASARYRNLVSKLGGLADKADLTREDILTLLRNEEDVTQEDNPAPEEEQ